MTFILTCINVALNVIIIAALLAGGISVGRIRDEVRGWGAKIRK